MLSFSNNYWYTLKKQPVSTTSLHRRAYVFLLEVQNQYLRVVILFFFVASGKKLTIAGKRPANATLSKSQTLPRSMGSRTTPVQPVRPFQKISSTPPAIKKQLSIPGNTSSPARRVNSVNGGK